MFQELDLLEAHLEESQHWADRIVIIESPVTFTSLPKPLYFSDNRARFARFNVEVLVTPADVFEPIPFSFPKEDSHQWLNARRRNRNLNRSFHWDTVRNGTDYVYFNDVDEFISRDHFGHLEEYLKTKEMYYGALKTRTFNYFVNGRGGKTDQARIARSDMDDFVMRKGTPRFTTALEIGWHFTSCMSIEDIHIKALGICSHIGLAVDDVPSVDVMRERLANLRDPLVDVDISGGFNEIMDRTIRTWAPRFIAENPGLFPWMEPGTVETTQEGWKL
jgi:hypothetical protein